MTWSQHRPSNGPPIRKPLGEWADEKVPTRKASLRKYSWVRCDHELLKSDLWGLVAEMADSERPVVEAFVQRLEIFANGNQPRGSVVGFNVAALAVTWRRPKEELARIYAALEHHDIAWLDQDHIVTFWARNPDEEDVTSPARSKRYRDRMRIVENGKRRGATEVEILDALEAAGLGYPPSRRVTRDAVTVTARAEQNIKPANSVEGKTADFSMPAGTDVHVLTTGPVDNSAAEPLGESAAGLSTEVPASDDAISTEAETWLSTEGTRIVVECMAVPTTRAQTLIERWRRDLQHDAPAMVQIIAQASGCANAAHFLVAVTDAVRRHIVTSTNGGSLSLGPVRLGPATSKPAPAAPLSEPSAESPPDFDVNRRRASGE